MSSNSPQWPYVAGAGLSVAAGIGAMLFTGDAVSVPMLYGMIALQEVLLIGLPALLLWLRNRQRKEHFQSLWKRPDIYPLGVTVFAAVSFILASILLTGLWLVFLQGLGFAPQEQANLPPPEGVLGFVWAIVTAAIVPAFCEEILFRGLLLGFLQRRWGSRLAVLLSGVAFSALHFSIQGFATLLFFGWFLAALAVRHKGLWLPVAAHAIYNTVVLAINASGHLPSVQLVFFGTGLFISAGYLLFRKREETAWN
ncbi:MAG: CPBP family intramembrane metalloprotease [Clostridiales bacterium]|nr:CPBP family intramembrane metalloprotease [Clostridiales bacterium]